jgi:hypothetical protein
MKKSIAGGIGLVLGLMTPGSAQDENGKLVVPRDSVAFGRTYSDWAAAWDQWARSIPATAHPLFDTADCAVAQTGPIFFLGAKFCSTSATSCSGSAKRKCTVPAGKALFFPIVGGGDSVLQETAPGQASPECAPELPNPTINCMRRALQAAVDPTTKLALQIDGKQIPDLKSNFRLQSITYDFTLPASDNILNAIGAGPFSGGTYGPAVGDGVFVMLAPLSPGKHALHFTGTFPQFSPPFVFEITYNLTVK